MRDFRIISYWAFAMFGCLTRWRNGRFPTRRARCTKSWTASYAPVIPISRFRSRTPLNSNLRAAVFCANLIQALSQDVREPGFTLRRDQANRIHVDEVGFVSQAETD